MDFIISFFITGVMVILTYTCGFQNGKDAGMKRGERSGIHKGRMQVLKENIVRLQICHSNVKKRIKKWGLDSEY